jgi:deoxyribodipyrimidine photo-lyase
VSAVPSSRLTSLTKHSLNSDGQFILYWMTAFRRSTYNFALQHAVDWSNRLKRPLVVLEAVRIRYPWASDRFHKFIVDGMQDNQKAFGSSKALYLAYVEPKLGDGHGLVESLAKSACLTITDDFPCFFHPTLYKKVIGRWPVAIEMVDSNGMLPMRSADRTFTVAHSYRRFMQKSVASEPLEFPLAQPLKELKVNKLEKLPTAIEKRWKFIDDSKAKLVALDRLPIDHRVKPTVLTGGSAAAKKLLEGFLQSKLSNYPDDRNEPEKEGSSLLSPYLHFGHISSHEIFQRLCEIKDWNPTKLSKPNGKMDGFWNMGSDVEPFLDQLITWREIGFNMCCREANYDRYESLPTWALETLKKHAKDRREHLYDLAEFEEARTHDELWNAAQRQLVRDGRIHNYLRMLWGKKILHWSRTPQDALDIMIHLNNKFALDGRNPNSYSGIFWVLGRYDRAWGPERPIFGKVRYMTSESTRSKFRVKDYLQRYRALSD